MKSQEIYAKIQSSILRGNLLATVLFVYRHVLHERLELWGELALPKETDSGYISIDEAAAYLGIKTVTLRNWIKNKEALPAHRIGKLWKFKRSELDAWVLSGKSANE